MSKKSLVRYGFSISLLLFLVLAAGCLRLEKQLEKQTLEKHALEKQLEKETLEKHALEKQLEKLTLEKQTLENQLEKLTLEKQTLERELEKQTLERELVKQTLERELEGQTATSKPGMVILRYEFDAREVEEQILNSVNRARAQEGLSTLAPDPTLIKIARQRSEDMIKRNYYSHFDPETSETIFTKLLAQHGYPNYIGATENVGLVEPPIPIPAYDPFEIAESFVKEWRECPSCWEEILSPDFSKIGVAIAISSTGKRIIATQILLGDE